MSEEKDVPLKKLSQEILKNQIEISKQFINQAQQQITALTQQIQQQAGVLGYAEHLLRQFDLPSAPEDPKKKKELEVI